MVSSTQIANMALSHVGARGDIESLNENSVEAKTCKIWYDHARRYTLEAHDWTFARKRLSLSLDGEDATMDWNYRYAHPEDCLVIREIISPYNNGYCYVNNIIGGGDTTPFIVELNSSGMKTILTDEPEATLRYTSDVSDTHLFSTQFVNAMSYALGSFVCMKLTNKLSTKQTMEQLFNITVKNAAAIDANQDKEKAPRDALWIRARI